MPAVQNTVAVVRARRHPLPQGGTFSANPLSMVAGIASMRALDEAAFEHLKPQPPRSYREAWPTPLERGPLARMSQFMLGQGVILPAFSSRSLSTVMTEADIDFFLAAFAEFLDALMDRGGVRKLSASRAAPG